MREETIKVNKTTSFGTDCISRQAVRLIESDNNAYPEAWNEDYEKGFCDAIDLVLDLPSAQQWTPCSEGFPEEHLCDDGYVEPSDYVLVWGDHGNYGVSRYWGNRRSKSDYKDWLDLDWIAQKPIAWMPLPKPYKKEEE